MNWQGVHATECPKDRYFDPHTGNCDPCAPLCAKTNCAQVCQDFKLPDVPSDPGAVSSPCGSMGTIFLLIIVAVFAFAFFPVCKRYYKKIKDWFICKRTKLSIEESKNDHDPQTVLLHEGTEIC